MERGTEKNNSTCLHLYINRQIAWHKAIHNKGGISYEVQIRNDNENVILLFKKITIFPLISAPAPHFEKEYCL